MNARDEATKLLKSSGGVLGRQRKHEVWKLPDGRTWVRASTPSDQRGDMNNLKELRNFLGVNDIRGQVGVRREKVPKQAKHATVPTGVLCDIGLGRDLRTALSALVRQFKPVHSCCYPMERIVIVRTPLSVILSHLMKEAA